MPDKNLAESNLFIGSERPDGNRAKGATVAVLGTGSIGSRHLSVLATAQGVRPLAIPLRSSRRAALERDGLRVCGSLGEAAKKGATHAVIATDTARHLDDSLEALRLGLHVLVEKPMAVDAGQGRRLLEEAGRLKRSLYVGCVLRFSESLNRFRQWLPKVGPVHSVQIECRSYLPDWRPGRDYRDSYSARAGEGGVLRDLIHEVDYAGWIFGWPSRVSGRLANLGQLGIEAEEIAELSWEAPGGVRLSLSLDYLTQPTRRGMKASGRRGTIEWDGVEAKVRLALAGSPVREFKSAQSRNGMFLEQARAFLEATAGGGRSDPRLATGEEGVRALAVCDAARGASLAGKEEQASYR
ncbi:MAG: Gfo/Idh/MocA family oxidoreductase [Candidatus Omnitrophica bacterium]|nr:Gfo/Idh/MocA family oxidoreductase [Candidatus Omnitrophota bacterium]